MIEVINSNEDRPYYYYITKLTYDDIHRHSYCDCRERDRLLEYHGDQTLWTKIGRCIIAVRDITCNSAFLISVANVCLHRASVV